MVIGQLGSDDERDDSTKVTKIRFSILNLNIFCFDRKRNK